MFGLQNKETNVLGVKLNKCKRQHIEVVYLR